MDPGNARMFAGDVMGFTDAVDGMDAADAISAVDSSSGGSDDQVHFGSYQEVPG
jgi:hypothetical protein